MQNRFPHVPFAGMFSSFEVGPSSRGPPCTCTRAFSRFSARRADGQSPPPPSSAAAKVSESAPRQGAVPALVAPRPAPSGARGRQARGSSRGGLADAGLALVVIGIVCLMVVPLPTWLLDILLAATFRPAVAILLVVLYVPDALGDRDVPDPPPHHDALPSCAQRLLDTADLAPGQRRRGHSLVRAVRRARELRRRRGRLSHPHHHPVRGDRQRAPSAWPRSARASFSTRCPASKWPSTPRRARAPSTATRRVAGAAQLAREVAVLRRHGRRDEVRQGRRHRLAHHHGRQHPRRARHRRRASAALEWTTALKRYGLLTIGDGLVTQNPRARALDRGRHAGDARGERGTRTPRSGRSWPARFFGTPKALQVAGCSGASPRWFLGCPRCPFSPSACFCSLGSRARRSRSICEQHSRHACGEPARPTSGPRRGPAFVPLVVPWSHRCQRGSRQFLEDETRGADGGPRGSRLRHAELRGEDLRRARRAAAPGARAVADALPARHVVVSLFEVPAKVIPLVDPGAVVDGARVTWTRSSPLLRDAPRTSWASQKPSICSISSSKWLPRSCANRPQAGERVAPRRRSAPDGRGAGRASAIFAPSSRRSRRSPRPRRIRCNLTEFVRGQLRRATTYRLTGGRRELSVFLLDPAIEEAIRHAITRTAAGSFLTLGARRCARRRRRDPARSCPQPLRPGRETSFSPNPTSAASFASSSRSTCRRPTWSRSPSCSRDLAAPARQSTLEIG